MPTLAIVNKDRLDWVAPFTPYFDSPFSSPAWQVWLNSESVMVAAAREGGEGIGIMIGERVVDEGEIVELCVLPEHRRQGVAGELLRFFLEEMQRQGAAKIFLEVRAGNAAARGLYAKAGFREIGMRKTYYKDGEDAIQMQLSF